MVLRTVKTVFGSVRNQKGKGGFTVGQMVTPETLDVQ